METVKLKPIVTLAQSRRAPVPTQFVKADGIEIAYRVMGEAAPGTPPLVFCNRFRGTMDEWDPAFLEALAPSRQLILFDYPGVASSTGSTPPDAEGIARATAAFIRALGLEHVDLIAFSMGGYVVQVLALLEPELVRRCILCGASCFGGPGSRPPESIFFETATKPEWDAEDKVILFYADAPDSRRRGMAAEGRIEAQLRTGGEPKVTDESWHRLLAAIETAAKPDNAWHSRMKEIEQPFLIIGGDCDPCYPLENQVLLYRGIPNSRLAILPMSGHAPQHQFPLSCADFVHDFLG
ncbi:MAG: alpha/beta hydrolase [Planctomycetota bacterium]